MGLRRLGRQGHIAEGADEHDIHLDILVNGSHAVGETIRVQLAIADFDRAHQAYHAALCEMGGQNAVEVAALIRRRGIAVDVVHAEGILPRAPGEGDIGEFRRQFLHNRPILRAMRNHQLIFARGRPIAQCDRGVVYNIGAVLNGELKSLFSEFFLDRDKGVVHALAESQIVGGAWHQRRDAKYIVMRRGLQASPSQEAENKAESYLFHASSFQNYLRRSNAYSRLMVEEGHSPRS